MKSRNFPSLAIFFLPYRQARGVTCLREAASAKAGGRFSQQYVLSILVNMQKPQKMQYSCHKDIKYKVCKLLNISSARVFPVISCSKKETEIVALLQKCPAIIIP
jgi:hypothetical protein